MGILVNEEGKVGEACTGGPRGVASGNARLWLEPTEKLVGPHLRVLPAIWEGKEEGLQAMPSCDWSSQRSM